MRPNPITLHPEQAAAIVANYHRATMRKVTQLNDSIVQLFPGMPSEQCNAVYDLAQPLLAARAKTTVEISQEPPAHVRQMFTALQLVEVLNDKPECNPPGYLVKLDPNARKQVAVAIEGAMKVLDP